MAGSPSSQRRTGVRLRPTLPGCFFLLVAVLVGLAAVKVKGQAPLTLVLFGGMLAAVAVSAVLARRMVGGVALERDVPDRLWQDRTAFLSYYLRNRRRWGASLGLRVEEVGPKDIQFAAGYCVHLEPGSVFRAGARFAPRRRGRARLRGIRLSTSFPFGLVRASRLFHHEASLVVWPARGRLTRQILHHGAVEASSAAPGPVQGGQDEFFGLRDYRFGDNPRWIHWRRSAARDNPVVREMARPRPEVLWVVLETYLPAATEAARRSRDKALRLASTLIDHAFARGYKVGLALAYDRQVAVYAPAPGVGQRCKLLDALADVDDNRTHGLAETVSRLNRWRLRDAQVVLIAAEGDCLAAPAVQSLRLGCGHLSDVCGDRMALFFQDDPLAQQESA